MKPLSSVVSLCYGTTRQLRQETAWLRPKQSLNSRLLFKHVFRPIHDSTRSHFRLQRHVEARQALVRRNLSTSSPSSVARSNGLIISEELKEALRTRKPVVALESTIYTHGFPYPENFALAKRLESLVREYGAIPATIGILNGRVHVGLDDSMLEQLVKTGDAGKVSRRDIAFTAGLTKGGKPLSGGTTIAGTMVLAHLAGIKVFATGGLGGVHRGGEVSMDVSADLTELGRTPVTVISSGCKGFLDIPRTLEFLETQGVGVATFADGREGQVDIPAFWSRDSGTPSPRVLESEKEAAAVIYAQHQLNIQSGLFFANPVPEDYSIPRAELEPKIEEAIGAATATGAMGSANTPFILHRLHELTNGKSVIANTALVEANIIRGAKVAVELSKLELSSENSEDRVVSVPSSASPKVDGLRGDIYSDYSHSHPTIVVAGSVAIDSACDYKPLAGTVENIHPQPWTSNPAMITQSIGGVGHNIARAAHLAGANVALVSAVADDLAGTALLQGLETEGLDTKFVGVLEKHTGHKTAQYVAVNDSRHELHLGMADMNIFEGGIDVERLFQPLSEAKSPPQWVVVDANWDPLLLKRIVALASRMNAKVAYEPVSAEKSTRLIKTAGSDRLLDIFPNCRVHLTTPNALELSMMHKAMYDAGLFELQEWWHTIDAMSLPSSGMRSEFNLATSPALVDAGVPQQTVQILPFIPVVATTLGAQGVLLTMLLHKTDPRLSSPDAAPYVISRSQHENSDVGGVYMRLFPPPEFLQEESVVSVNGAGDTFTGALLSYLVQQGEFGRVEDAVDFAQQASLLTLLSRESVAKDIETLALRFKSRRQ